MVMNTVVRRILLMIVAVAALGGPIVAGISPAAAADDLELRGVLTNP